MLLRLVSAVLVSLSMVLAPAAAVPVPSAQASEVTTYGAGSTGRSWVCQTFGLFC